MAPWFRHGREALDYLATLPEGLPGITVAVEFRDASWLPDHTDEVLPFLAERGLTYVSVDTPRTPANVSSDLALTSPVAVIRLHGRNVQGFMRQLRGQAPTVAEKYGYLYDSTEIAEIVARGRGLDGQASRIYFKLNNNVGDAPPSTACRSGTARPGHGRSRPGGGGVAAAPASRPLPLTLR
jgi:uncharacterized protein YecE (DUF72 family)